MPTRRPGPSGAGAASELFPVVYGELRKVARQYLGRERAEHTLQPTALVHEAWLRLRDQRRVAWQGRTHVLAVGAQAMRRVLVDHGRAQKRVKRGGGAARLTLHDWLDAAEDRPLDIEEALALDDALTRLAALDERQATVVEMRYFGGLSVAEVAELLGVSTRTVEGEWTHARAWLRRELSAAGAP
ncbi:MAG: sigma-70 family RNA polymerase sigma factor [Vicinamibacterales bacterium]